MSRYVSWLAVGIAAAFLVVATAAFSPSSVAALAFAVSIGTLGVSAGIAYIDRKSIASAYTAVLVALISVWTIIASLVFSPSTVQDLALGSSLAIGGLVIVGLTTHELAHVRATSSVAGGSTESESSAEPEARLAAAA